jgi:hypothetical protein
LKSCSLPGSRLESISGLPVAGGWGIAPANFGIWGVAPATHRYTVFKFALVLRTAVRRLQQHREQRRACTTLLDKPAVAPDPSNQA